MIINKMGAEFLYEGITYRIGDKIIGTDESEYAGLCGTILEIRDGKEKETENEMPDIYCSFDSPVLPEDKKALEETFSSLYGAEKHLEDICLDLVIMTPSMIRSLSRPPVSIRVYVLTEEWVSESEKGRNTRVYTNLPEAKGHLNSFLADEINSGCVSDWIDKEDYMTETSALSYEGWLKGRYRECHYGISIEEMDTGLTDTVVGNVGRAYMDRSQRKDFIALTKKWKETAQMMDSQRQKLFSDPRIPERIHSKLSKNDDYWGSYWMSVSEAGHEMIAEYLVRNAHLERPIAEEVSLCSKQANQEC